MAASKPRRLGSLSPKYKFLVNPYPDQHISRCPLCEGKAGQRKLPLLIHVNPDHLIALNYTCRYCRDCELLVAHKHEVEYYLHRLFLQQAPEAIGNDYLIIGTVEKKTWREGMQQANSIEETLAHASDFKSVYNDLRVQQGGWFPIGQEPPIMEPPPSQDWVKHDSH